MVPLPSEIIKHGWLEIPCQWRFQWENHWYMVDFPASHVWLPEDNHGVFKPQNCEALPASRFQLPPNLRSLLQSWRQSWGHMARCRATRAPISHKMSSLKGRWPVENSQFVRCYVVNPECQAWFFSDTTNSCQTITRAASTCFDMHTKMVSPNSSSNKYNIM